MKHLRAAGIRLLAFAAAVVAVAMGLALERSLRGPDRALGQQMVIHHFERSSWFATRAPDYETIDPELARRFREMAAWHARRAREFQRMDPGAVARESERDLDHDIVEGRLMDQALKCDSILAKKSAGASRQTGEGGGEARSTSPGLDRRPR